jgi:hypothetical protein
MSAYMVGSLVGTIFLTGLISRILDKYTFKKQIPTQKAIFISLITISICIVMGSSRFGVIGAFLQYSPGVVIWLIFDLIRSNRS